MLHSHIAEHQGQGPGFATSVVPGNNQVRTYTAIFNGIERDLEVVDQGWIGTIESFESDRSDVDAHDTSARLDLTVDRPVAGPYRASIYNHEGARIFHTTSPSANLNFSVPVTVPSGESRTYRAFIAQDAPETGPPTDDVRASADVTVTNRGWFGSVALTAGTHSVANPWEPVWLTASTSRTLGDVYNLSVYDEAGARRFTTGPSRFLEFEFPVIPGTSGVRTYTAYVSRDAPASGPPTDDVRAVASLTFEDGQLVDERMEGVGLEDLVARLAGLSDAEVMRFSPALRRRRTS